MPEPTGKTWADNIAGATPITAAELNRMEALIVKAFGSDAIFPPASPNAMNDEFDGTSTATWSNTPTAPASVSVNGTVPNALLITSSGLAGKHVGRVQAVPSLPFTVTTRLLSTQANANFQKTGILLGPASPTGASSMFVFGLAHNSGPQVARWSGTFDASFTNETNRAYIAARPPVWLRMVVNSATSVDLQWSAEGKFWITHQAGLNPGFTPGVVGLSVSDDGANTGMSSIFDFFRVT